LIYIDTSVALAQLLGEDRRPPESLSREPLVSSRLLEYELWSRVHAYDVARSHGDLIRDFLLRVALVKLDPLILARAIEPFPRAARTLDALHLATLHYLHEHGQRPALASYDARMLDIARALKWPIYELP